MKKALYINGVFEVVLEEILDAQREHPDRIFYLQPHDSRVWRQFEEEQVPVKLLMSITDDLDHVHFECTMLGWKNKTDLSLEEKERITDDLETYQPNEGGLYIEKGEGKTYKNLLLIQGLERLTVPIRTSMLLKRRNKEPLASRARSGGGSAVFLHKTWNELKELGNSLQIEDQTSFDKEQRSEMRNARKLSATELEERAMAVTGAPPKVYVRSKQYVRNAYVRELALRLANGICQDCKEKAPFLRPNGEPFLEVHHIVPLAEGGDDTVRNSIALCPNCHRKRHFG